MCKRINKADMKDIIEMAHSIKVAVLAEVGEDYSNMLESRIAAVDYVTQKITEQYICSDYWTRLEHTYAGMAMQGLMSILPQIGGLEGRSPKTEIIDIATDVAHALVEKLKEKEERK